MPPKGGKRRKSGTKSHKAKQKQDGAAGVHDNNNFDDSEWECLSCKTKIVANTDLAMECENCENSFCLPCIDMTEELYKSPLLTRPDIIWLCKACNRVKDHRKNMGDPFVSDSGINELKQEVESKISVLQKNMESMSKELKKSLAGLEKSVNEKITITMTDNSNDFKEHVEQVQNNVTKSFKDVLLGPTKTDSSNKEPINMIDGFRTVMVDERREQIRLHSEKEEKEKNVILYRIKEVKGIDFEERKMRDNKNVETVLGTIGLNDIQVKATFRIGRFNEEKHDEGKCRPLKVVLFNKSDKDSMMRNAFKLNDSSDAEIRSIHVGHDLTVEERQTVNETLEKAKELNRSQNQFFYKVRGPPWKLWLKKEKRIERQTTDGETTAEGPVDGTSTPQNEEHSSGPQTAPVNP